MSNNYSGLGEFSSAVPTKGGQRTGLGAKVWWGACGTLNWYRSVQQINTKQIGFREFEKAFG